MQASRATGPSRAEGHQRLELLSSPSDSGPNQEYCATRMSQIIELPQLADPNSAVGGACRVIVLNDNHNTFDSVAHALASTLPNTTMDKGYTVANEIHQRGQAIVWSGHQELAEHYWLQLKDHGLTMAPLEQG